MKYFDEHTKELIKNDDNSELIVNIELEFTKKNGKWISNETISKYILKRLNGY
ncbi:hypothetical protein [uncultured Leptotrichia sp.]|nr:hypothetical protein [uncultured Leptotrichia sp.]